MITPDFWLSALASIDFASLADRGGGPGAAVIPLSLLGFAITWHVVRSIRERSRRREVEAELSRLGFQVTNDPCSLDKTAAFDALGTPWIDLKDGPRGVRWAAHIVADGHDMTLVEYRYVTGRGKHKTEHLFTIAVIKAPGHWPEVTLTPESFMDKVGAMFGERDLQVEDAAFNARWRVRTRNEDFAFLLLSPEFQAWSMRLDPSRTSIRVGGRAITVCKHRRLDAAGCKSLMADCIELARLIPAELHAWERGSRRFNAVAA